MTPILRLLMASLLLILVTGCAQNRGKYSWGDYDGALYTYYKHPSETAAYGASLEKVVLSTDASGKPVAPGLYAEYGYFLMQEQHYADAVIYFGKERDAWPESKQFMDGMIKLANQKTVAHSADAGSQP